MKEHIGLQSVDCLKHISLELDCQGKWTATEQLDRQLCYSKPQGPPCSQIKSENPSEESHRHHGIKLSQNVHAGLLLYKEPRKTQSATSLASLGHFIIPPLSRKTEITLKQSVSSSILQTRSSCKRRSEGKTACVHQVSN